MLKTLILIGFLALHLPANAAGVNHYHAAKTALAKNNFTEYRTLVDDMGDYLLRGVIESEYLLDTFAHRDTATIESFLSAYPDVYANRDIRSRYLKRLRKQGENGKFLAFYNEDITEVELKCYYFKLKAATSGIDAELDAQIESLWLTANSRPDECDAVFSAWDRAGNLTQERVWKRIELAMTRSRYRLASYLARTYLPEKQQSVVELWIDVRANPRAKLTSTRFIASDRAGGIIVDGLEQIAREDPALAEQTWLELTRKSPGLERFEPQAYARIGFRAAINHHPGASRYMLKASFEDEDVRHWAIRAALRDNQWPYVLEFFPRLNDEERSEPQWRYWQARALENTGKEELARKIYAGIAGERDYYSFLAADRLGLEYDMNNYPIEASTSVLGNDPAFAIARELYAVESPSYMRRQWQWAIRNLDEQQLKAAAKLASNWGFHDRAIITAGRARYYDDVNLRFPVIHRQPITNQAKRRKLPESYVYGIMRQESAFMENVRSPAGALGLMQVMPDTGRLIWKKQKKRNYHSSILLDPSENIDAGTFYLREMLDRFDNHYAMATAAYNAGPGRAEQWRANRALDADIWIETIPFRETRGYVKNVLAYKAIYDHQLGLDKHQILAMLPRVNAG